MKLTVLAALLPLAIALPASALTYQITDLGSIEPDQAMRAYGISRNGDVVGWSDTAHGPHAFVLRGGVLQDLGTLGGKHSYAYGINSRGHAVGEAQTREGLPHAFVDRGKGLEDLGTLGGATSSAIGINRAGEIVGKSTRSDGQSHAFLYKDGSMADLGSLGGDASFAIAINDSGQVVGTSLTADRREHAFLYAGGVMTNLGTLGGEYSGAYAVNAAGAVTGYATVASGDPHAFLYSDGEMQDLGLLPMASRCQGAALNDKGEVIGSCDVHSKPVPFVYRHGRMHSLKRFLDPVSGAGWSLNEVRGINNAGQIVGTGKYEHGKYRAILLTPLKP